MMKKITVFVLFFLTTIWVGHSSAIPLKPQATGDELAKALEGQLLSGSAVQMKFNIKGVGNVTITADANSNKVRVETSGLTIVSDGNAVWNYNKSSHQVTIDNVTNASGGLVRNPKQFFQFGEQYTSQLVSENNGQYVLALTPGAGLQASLASLGGLKTITLTVAKSGKGYRIKKAVAEGSKGTTETGPLTISSLKHVSASTFNFAAPQGSKVIDLRE